MSEKKIVVPEPLYFHDWWNSLGRYIDPDTEDVPWYDKRQALCEAAYAAGQSSVRFAEAYATLSLSPEPEVPEAIKDLLESNGFYCANTDDHNKAVIEAYKRGKEGN